MSFHEDIAALVGLAQTPFRTCFSEEATLPLTATELLRTLPLQPGVGRERAVLDAVSRGRTPSWLRTWWPVSWRRSRGGVDFTVEVRVLPDYLCVGTDADYVYVNITPLLADVIGLAWKAYLPTREIARRIYEAAPQRVPAQPWGPPYGSSMMSTQRWPIQTGKIRHVFDAKSFDRGVLTAGHYKDMVVGEGMAKAARPSNTVGIWGWFRKDGSVIQGPPINWRSHEVTYTDYSHGCRFVYEEVVVNGRAQSLESACANPDTRWLFTDEPSLPAQRYLTLYGGSGGTRSV